MSVIHIVLFKLKASLSGDEVTEFCNHLLSLRTACVQPSSSKPYIISASGGKDHSPEGLQGGFTHGFVFEFASKEDRDYYVSDDPAHLAFVKKNSPRFDEVKVIDFSKGVY